MSYERKKSNRIGNLEQFARLETGELFFHFFNSQF
jgi:hypothetical protein